MHLWKSATMDPAAFAIAPHFTATAPTIRLPNTRLAKNMQRSWLQPRITDVESSEAEVNQTWIAKQTWNDKAL
jgi:hypothetical protein